MQRTIHLFLVLMVTIILTSSSCQTSPGNSDLRLSESYYTDLYSFDETGKLGRGINMGNFLESPLSEGGEGAWINGTGLPIQQKYFTTIKEAGFKTVRIPIRWSDYAGESAPYTIDPAFMTRVKTIVDWALAADLIAVLDFHHYVEMMDNSDSNDLAYHQARLVSIWDQICDVFTIEDYPIDKVYYELLNEPNGRVGYEEWNTIIAELNTLIRTTKGQSERVIVIGTANWGGLDGLNLLEIPADCDNTNTIITFHYYLPFQFTHQGASWVNGSDEWIGLKWQGTKAEIEAIAAHMDDAVYWSSMAGDFQLWMGEFGAYSKHIPEDQQKAWTACVTREAEKQGISWAYWEFCSGFGAYDWKTEEWNDHVLKALVPASN